MQTVHRTSSTSRAAWLGAIAGLALGAAWRAAGAQPAPLAAGVTAASFSWEDGRREQALALVVQGAPTPWLALGATPTLLRAAGPDGASRAGFADLPVFAGLTAPLALPMRPQLAVAGVASIPTGDARRGLGRGTTLASAEATLALSPLPALTVRAGGSRLVRDGGLLPDEAPRTAAFGDVVVALGARTNASVGLAGEVDGRGAWREARARTANAAVVRAIAGRTMLLVSGGRTLAGAGPAWSLSLGVGSAFGGISPVGATSVRGRLPTGSTPTSGTGQPLAPAPRGLCGLLPTC